MRAEGFFATIIIPDDARTRRRFLETALEIADFGQAFLLAEMVIEPEAATFRVGNVGQHIGFVHFFLAILNVFGMHKLVAAD